MKRTKRSERVAVLVGPIVPELSGRKGWRWLREQIKTLDTRHATWIGVDGGAEVLLRLGICPDLAIGDWDSVRNLNATLEKLPKKCVLELSRRKDRSDLFYALELSEKLRVDRVVCLGFVGGRMDHQLAVFYELSEAARGFGGGKISALAPDASYWFISTPAGKSAKKAEASWSARLPIGETVSVFSIGEEAKGVTLEGFEYPFKKAALPASSRGLSNQVAQSEVRVSVKQGKLLVIAVATTQVG